MPQWKAGSELRSRPEPVSVDGAGHTKSVGTGLFVGKCPVALASCRQQRHPGGQWFMTLRAWRCEEVELNGQHGQSSSGRAPWVPRGRHVCVLSTFFPKCCWVEADFR